MAKFDCITKYNVGNELMHSEGIDSVDLKIIFVPPVDGYGMQHYLCTVLSGYNDGAKKMYLTLAVEKGLDKYFKPRMKPFESVRR